MNAGGGGLLALFFAAMLLLTWTVRAVRPQAAIAIVLAGSLLFYALADPGSLPLIAILVLVNHGLGRRISEAPSGSRRRVLIATGIGLNLFTLVAFKAAASAGMFGSRDPN